MENNAVVDKSSVSTTRWIYLDVCKIAAMFLVVVMHVASGAWGQLEIGTFDWHVVNVFNIISRICIPLFFMQTGALLLNENKELSIKKLYSKYILRIVTAFFFWSIINMVIYYWQQAPGGFSDFTIGSFIVGVLEGAPYVHWFIFLSISMYLLVPILRAIAKNMTATRYFLILWAVFAFGVPFLRQLPYLFTNLPTFLQDFINQLGNASDRVRPNMIMEYPGYLLLGHYIHVTVFSRKTAKTFGVIGLVSLLYTIFVTIIVSTRDGAPTEAYFGNFTPNILLMAASFMILAKTYLEKTWFSNSVYKGIRFYSVVTFGIFLVHDVLRMQLVRLGLTTLSFTPILSVPVLSIAIFVVSGWIAFLIKKIPGVGKYIV